MRYLIAIVGPTAAGKTSVSLRIARNCNGEIVNADSRQIYRYMDIGTSKPSAEERRQVPHHLFDIINPDQPYSIALYRNAAKTIINDIQDRNAVPIVTGGSGLYVWSLLENWTVPVVAQDDNFRRKLFAEANEKGSESLYNRLINIDPDSATKILPGNVRRIIRALEIFEMTGQPASCLRGKGSPSFPVLVIGLDMPRTDLYRLIDNRVDNMIKQGLIDEVRSIAGLGYNRALPSMSSIGYKQIFEYLDGEIELDEAISRIKTKTHAFARRQYAWFHTDDSRIHWFNRMNLERDVYRDIMTLIDAFTRGIKNGEIGNIFF